MVKPIPKKLLIHSIVYTPPAESNGWDTQQGEPINVDNVRVDPTKTYSYSSDSTSNQPSHIIFVDKRNSSTFPEFQNNGKITWQGGNLTINKVVPVYGLDDTPHHYELEVV